jgi:hypothetical protein
MKKFYSPVLLFPILFLFGAQTLFAGPVTMKTPVLETRPPESDLPLTEIKIRGTHTFESDFEEAPWDQFEGVSVSVGRFDYTQRIPLGADDWYFRTGARYEYWHVSETDAPLPDTLQSIALPLGLEWNKGKFFKFLLMTYPGVYFSTDIDVDDFDFPTLALYGFDLTDDFKLYVGAVGSTFSQYGVLPVGGFVWSPKRWLIVRGTFPEAGVYLSTSEELTFFLGGQFLTGSFRVDREDDFPPALREAIIDYTGIRVGGHVTWRPSDTVNITLGGGYEVFREFEYERADVELQQEGAPYVKAAVTFKF